MDWTQIIACLVSAIFGGSISAFVIKIATLQSTKKKASAEADNAAIEPLRATIDLLSKQLSDSAALVKEKDGQIGRQSQTILDLSNRITALYDDICVHKGCKLRKPHQGQGKRWYDEHSEDPSFGCDYLSVEWLLKCYRKNNQEIPDSKVPVE